MDSSATSASEDKFRVEGHLESVAQFADANLSIELGGAGPHFRPFPFECERAGEDDGADQQPGAEGLLPGYGGQFPVQIRESGIHRAFPEDDVLSACLVRGCLSPI